MEFFLARFDPSNYTETPQDDGPVLITMRWPPHLEQIAQQSQGDMNLRMLSMTLALRARRLLEGQETLAESNLPEFAAQLQQLAGWKDPRDNGSQEHYRIDSVAGGLSVLVIKHRDWLSKNPELEKWCLETLRDAPDPEVRHTAVKMLATVNWQDNPEAVMALVHTARTDKHPGMRVASVRSLASMKACTPEVMTGLKPMTADPDEWIRSETMQALSYLQTVMHSDGPRK